MYYAKLAILKTDKKPIAGNREIKARFNIKSEFHLAMSQSCLRVGLATSGPVFEFRSDYKLEIFMRLVSRAHYLTVFIEF